MGVPVHGAISNIRHSLGIIPVSFDSLDFTGAPSSDTTGRYARSEGKPRPAGQGGHNAGLDNVCSNEVLLESHLRLFESRGTGYAGEAR